MGITGTWSGYVGNDLWIYNHGTWSNMTTPGFTGVSGYTPPTEANGEIRVNESKTVITKFGINGTGYKYLKFNLWAAAGYGSVKFELTLLSSPNGSNLLSKNQIFARGAWSLISIPIENINTWFYIKYSMWHYQNKMTSDIDDGRISEIYMTNY